MMNGLVKFIVICHALIIGGVRNIIILRRLVVSGGSTFCKAFIAIYRAVSVRFEGNLGDLFTLIASHFRQGACVTSRPC